MNTNEVRYMFHNQESQEIRHRKMTRQNSKAGFNELSLPSTWRWEAASMRQQHPPLTTKHKEKAISKPRHKGSTPSGAAELALQDRPRPCSTWRHHLEADSQLTRDTETRCQVNPDTPTMPHHRRCSSFLSDNLTMALSKITTTPCAYQKFEV